LLPAFAFRYAAHLRRVAWAIRFRGRGAEHVSSGSPAKPHHQLVCPAAELFPDRRDLLI
jgi:hypothetical protein